MKVSIIIPVVRPDKAKRCIEAIKKNAGIPEKDYEIITEVDKEGIGCPKMVKKLVEKTNFDNVCFLGDDTIPQANFLKNAISAMKKIPGGGWGLVGLASNPKKTEDYTHWLASKKLLKELDGEFFHTGYIHCFCDDELATRAKSLKRFIYAFNAVIKHDHPIFNKDANDEHYERVYNKEVYATDKELFDSRSRSNFGKWEVTEPPFIIVAIPAPETVMTNFALSLAQMVAYSVVNGARVEIVHHSSALVQTSRNQMVMVAKEKKADKILFIDSDMTFPPNTLLRLLMMDKDIICTDAAKRMFPSTPVVRDLNSKYLDHTSKLEEVVEVLGLSTGVCMIDMKVFDAIEEPYFHVEYKGDRKFIGEDYYMGFKAKEKGYKIYCDTKLSKYIGHIGYRTYSLMHDVNWKELYNDEPK